MVRRVRNFFVRFLAQAHAKDMVVTRIVENTDASNERKTRVLKTEFLGQMFMGTHGCKGDFLKCPLVISYLKSRLSKR